MENKKLMATVCTDEIIFENSAELPIDMELNLPDYLPDISRILKCKAISRISSKGINGASALIDGCVTITVIYADTQNKIYCYEYQYPFSKRFDLDADNENYILNAKSKCEYINCRAITGRKIDIHGATSIKLCLKSKKALDVLSDFDDTDIELNRITVPATTPMAYEEKYIIVEEDIDLTNGQPEISSIMRYEASAVIKENKLINKKQVIKGELNIFVLYCATDGSLQRLKNTLPFSQILEMDNVTDECTCEATAEISYLEIKPKPSVDSKCRVFSVSSKLLLKTEAYCDNDIYIIVDAFSKNYEAKLKTEPIKINKLCKNINETFNCKKTLTLGTASISSVTDLWSDIQNINCCIEENTVILKGNICVNILAFDDEQTPFYTEKNIEFDYKYPLNDNFCGELFCDSNAKVMALNYTISSNGEIEVRIELLICISLYSQNKLSAITDISVDNTVRVNNGDYGALTVCFATEGDALWDIAMHYHASIDEIRKVNNLECEVLPSDKMLIIPV